MKPQNKSIDLYLPSASARNHTGLGYKDVRVLDGGWGIWDRAFTLPVVQGDQPCDEGFAFWIPPRGRH